MNQENCLEKKKCLLKKKLNKHFHLKTLFVIFLILFCIDIVSFNSIMNANSTNNVKYNHLTEIEAIPKNNNPILPVQPFLHPIAPPDYDNPYDVYLSWDQVDNKLLIQIFISTTKNYSTAVLIKDNLSGYATHHIHTENYYYFEKKLGNTYYYFIKISDEEGSVNSNWQNVTLPQVLFDQPLEIKISDVTFTVKSLANLSYMRLIYWVGEETKWGPYDMESSNQKNEDGYYTFSKQRRIVSEGPLFYYYVGVNQENDIIYLGNTNNENPLISPQDIRITTDHFKLIVGFVAIVAYFLVYIILVIIKKLTFT